MVFVSQLAEIMEIWALFWGLKYLMDLFKLNLGQTLINRHVWWLARVGFVDHSYRSSRDGFPRSTAIFLEDSSKTEETIRQSKQASPIRAIFDSST